MQRSRRLAENPLLSSTYSYKPESQGRHRKRPGRQIRATDKGGAAAAGRVISSLFALLLAGGGILACHPEPPAPAEDPGEDLSVLLIVIDTLRADRVGFMGHQRPTSPKMDGRSSEWIVYEDAFAPAPFTMPSVAALMTGQYPDRTGVVNHSGDSALKRKDLPTLAELAQKAGRRTAAVVTNPWLLNPHMEFDRGFATFLGGRRGSTPAIQRDAANVTGHALELLDEIGDQPFVLWAHYLDPHMPYVPAPKHARALGLANTRSQVVTDFVSSRSNKQKIYFKADYPADEIEKTRLLYEAEIRQVDHAVGALLDGLAVRKRDKDTIVVLVSDHGESLGEHSLWFAHDFTLYQELLHVLLAIRIPGEAGRRIDTPVSLIDVLPTLCERLKMDCAVPMDGRALPLQPPRQTAESEKRTLFAASAPIRERYKDWPRLEVRGLAGRWRAARRGDLKLIKIPKLDGPSYEAFDLASDPLEENNLWPSRAFIPLLDQLEEWEATMDASTPRKRESYQLDEDTRRELEALGYLEAH